MKFNSNDLDAMRRWLYKLPANPRIKRARLIYFDIMRYREAYEELYHYIESMGGKIIQG